MLSNVLQGRRKNSLRCDSTVNDEEQHWVAVMPLLADLLQDLAGGLPGDSLESQQTYREPLRQQALQRTIQVLWEKKGSV